MSKVVPMQRERRGRPTRPVWTKEKALAVEFVDMSGIAAIAEVTDQAVRKWRSAYLAETAAAKAAHRKPRYDENCLLAPYQELALGGIFRVDDVVRWLRDTRRMAQDSYDVLHRGGKQAAQAA